MGVILQGILGGFSGKVGPVVGGKWKDIDYMRGYVIPANPNTAAQQTVRAKFSALVAIARQLVSGLFQPFWDPFYSTMSGFNKFISKNYSLLTGTNHLDENAIMSLGTLEPLYTLAATYNTVNGSVEATWDASIYNNGADEDSCVFVVYNSEDDTALFFNISTNRSDAVTSLDYIAGYTATNVYVYALAFRGTGSELIVSDSLGAECTAP